MVPIQSIATKADSGVSVEVGGLVERIRRAIMEGRFAPGIKLGQEALAAQFSTSRSQVREALRRLEDEGLLESKPGRGSRVSRFDIQEFRDAYELRLLLEPLATRKSVPNLASGQIAELVELNDAISRSGELSDWLHADRVFHLKVYSGAGDSRLLDFINELQNVTQQYRRAAVVLAVEGDRKSFESEHNQILSAIKKGDTDLAAVRVEAHIRNTVSLINEHYQAGTRLE